MPSTAAPQAPDTRTDKSARRKANAELAVAHSAYEKGDYNTAISSLQQAYEIEPSVSVLYNIAQTCREAGLLREALKLYAEVLQRAATDDEKVVSEAKLAELRPQVAEIESAAATRALDAKRYQEAIAGFQRAVALKPAPAYLFHLGEAQRLAGNNAEAIASYKRVLAESPESVNAGDARRQLGALLAQQADAEATAYYDKGEYVQAVLSWDAAYREEARPIFLFRKAEAMRQTGQNAESAAAYERFLHDGSSSDQIELRVWGTDANNFWIVGTSGLIFRWNGKGFTTPSSDTGYELNGVWGSDVNNFWAVGTSGAVQQWNGASWTAQSLITTANLTGVWGSDSRHVWAVASDGTVAMWDGTAWGPLVSIGANFNAVTGYHTTNVWAVGNGGSIMAWTGGTWTAQKNNVTANLNGAWAFGPTNVWAVGANGTILKGPGNPWVVQQSNTTAQLYAVWGVDINNVWAVGAGGTILRWNGTAWTAQTSGTNMTLYAVWGSDINNVWAAGDQGVLLRWNGIGWTQPSSDFAGGSSQLRGLWGADAQNVWAVGY